MSSLAAVFTSERLAELFPPERTDAFFEALFGGAEEGAYDIRLAFTRGTECRLDFVFELHQRGDACLACNLTHGLPQVFARHPVIDTAGLAAVLASLAGWPEGGFRWELERTEEVSDARGSAQEAPHAAHRTLPLGTGTHRGSVRCAACGASCAAPRGLGHFSL